MATCPVFMDDLNHTKPIIPRNLLDFISLYQSLFRFIQRHSPFTQRIYSTPQPKSCPSNRQFAATCIAGA